MKRPARICRGGKAILSRGEAMKCMSCGVENLPQSQFCMHCGSKLAAESECPGTSKPVQLRQVTSTQSRETISKPSLLQSLRNLFSREKSGDTAPSKPGTPYVWQKKNVLRASSGPKEGRGHFGVDYGIYDVPDVSNSAKKVYVYLSRVADAEGYCFPFLRTIASRNEMSESTARKAIKELEEAELVEIQHRYSRRGGSSSLYHLKKVEEVYIDVDEKSANAEQKSATVAQTVSDHKRQ